MREVHPRRKCCTGYHFAAITLHESRRELTPGCPALSPVVKKKKKKIYILGIGEKPSQQEEEAPVTHTGEPFLNEAEERNLVGICTITSEKIYIVMWIIIKIQYVICLNNLTTIFEPSGYCHYISVASRTTSVCYGNRKLKLSFQTSDNVHDITPSYHTCFVVNCDCNFRYRSSVQKWK